jgi:hypothetical protein
VLGFGDGNWWICRYWFQAIQPPLMGERLGRMDLSVGIRMRRYSNLRKRLLLKHSLVGLKAPITVRDLHSEVRRDWKQLIGRKLAHSTAVKTGRAPIGLDMDRIQGLSNPYPFRDSLSNPYPIYPLNPWITWIGCGNGHVKQVVPTSEPSSASYQNTTYYGHPPCCRS